jgi:hypothetical protein
MGKDRLVRPIIAAICTLTLGASQDITHAASPITLNIVACPGNIQIAVISTDADQYASVSVQTNNGQVLSVPMVNSSHDGTAFTDYYQSPIDLGFDSSGIATASFADGSTVSTSFITDDCGLPYARLSSARGSVFYDLNRNAHRDTDESVTFSWFKISDGGSWHVCGYTGIDGTFGVPLKPGWYAVIPVAPKGWRATTPQLRVYVGGPGHPALNINLGLVRDETAPLESCDQYHPIR